MDLFEQTELGPNKESDSLEGFDKIWGPTPKDSAMVMEFCY